jgi:hypothetical protein
MAAWRHTPLRCPRLRARQGRVHSRRGLINSLPPLAPLVAPLPARRQQVDKKTVLENLDLVLLAVDEIVDRG